MVRKNRARSSSLFLMELIIAILFFSAASAVCVQFFVKSHLLSQDSNALNHAVTECAGAAEIARTSHGISDCIEILSGLYPNGNYPDSARSGSQNEPLEADISIYYDDSFTACPAEDSVYLLALHLTEDGELLKADIKMTKVTEDAATGSDDGEPVYELQAAHHIARRTDYESK